MGHIEITDGLATRRIDLPEIRGTIRIDVENGEPAVELPASATVTRRRVPSLRRRVAGERSG